MRADRLLAELTLLQARGQMTAAELAIELEVTPRTVYRDMYALQVAGVPLVTERGRGGGYSLYGDWRADLTGLTSSELESLLVAAASSPVARTGSRAVTAAAKLAAMLPPDTAGELGSLRRRIHVVVEADETDPGVGSTVASLLDSLRRRVSINLVLRRVRTRSFVRRAHPIGLIIRGRDWYFVWHEGDGRPRIDDVGDVVSAQLETTAAIDAGPADLSEVWREWYHARRGSERRYEVVLRIDHDLVDYWRDRHDIVDLAEGAAGVEAVARFNSAIEARMAVLPWGGGVEVVSPRALRLSVADFARQAAAVYANG